MILIIPAENEGKSVQLHYPDKIRLVALTQQAYYGKYAEDKVPPLGAFDVIGKDRRYVNILICRVTRHVDYILPFVEKQSSVTVQIPYT